MDKTPIGEKNDSDSNKGSSADTTDGARELVQIFIPNLNLPRRPPLAEPEEDLESSTHSGEDNHKDQNVTQRLQLLPAKEEETDVELNVSPKSDFRGSFQKLSKSKLLPTKSSLYSSMDKLVKGPKKLRKRTSDDTKLNFVVGFLFLGCMLLIGTARVIYVLRYGEIEIFSNVVYEKATRIIRFERDEGEHLIELSIANGLHPKSKPFDCSSKYFKDDKTNNRRCLEWYNLQRLIITHEKLDETINCYNIFWQSLSNTISPMDCFATGSENPHKQKENQIEDEEEADEEEELKSKRPLKDQGQWYGGGESLQAAWPLQKGEIKLTPFVTGDEGQTEWGNAIRKYFLNSRGVSLTVADQTPLFVSLNNPPRSGLCLQARFDDFAYYYHRFVLPRLNYTICMNGNLNNLHKKLLPKSFLDGHKQKDLDLLHHIIKTPIWQVPSDETLTHESLVKYVNNIVEENPQSKDQYSNGNILLDYHWQEKMGDLKFKKEKFPNSSQTLQMLKDKGLKLFLTVSPFISTESDNFALGVKNNIFVSQRNASATVPALTWFKDVASCGMLDITNNNTALWLQQQLRNLMQDIVGNNQGEELDQQDDDGRDQDDNHSPVAFFLQTGNTFHTPSYFKFALPLDNPDLFRDHFINTVMEEVPVIGVSGASSRRPKAPAFVSLSPLEPKWSHLQSIIPNVLQLSIIGYPFISPGPIGGVPLSQPNLTPDNDNETISITSEDEQDVELFIRWWQLNTFLPVIHFVKLPKAFPDALISKVSKTLKEIRSNVVVPELIHFSNISMDSSVPIIRPLWMIDPLDSVTHVIDDQFLIGDRILVAPVLKSGQRERNVYLPKVEGDPENKVIWIQSNNKQYLQGGGRWLNDTKVDLHEVLFFVRKKADPNQNQGLSN